MPCECIEKQIKAILELVENADKEKLKKAINDEKDIERIVEELLPEQKRRSKRSRKP